MTLRKCANPLCEVLVTPNVAGAHQGCCSRECERQMHKQARPQPPVPPATWQERPAVLRRNGKDNRN